ncbi:MAG: hypothetical protein ABIP56_08665 [Dokdonella sp.]
MNLKALRLAADFAAQRQHLRYDQMMDVWRPWRYKLRPSDHPKTMVAASFASGALLARVPGGVVVGSISSLLGIASFFLRSPISSLIVATIATARTKKRGHQPVPPSNTSVDSPRPLPRDLV